MKTRVCLLYFVHGFVVRKLSLYTLPVAYNDSNRLAFTPINFLMMLPKIASKEEIKFFFTMADTLSYLGIPLTTSYTPKKLFRSMSPST